MPHVDASERCDCSEHSRSQGATIKQGIPAITIVDYFCLNKQPHLAGLTESIDDCQCIGHLNRRLMRCKPLHESGTKTFCFFPASSRHVDMTTVNLSVFFNLIRRL